MLHEGFGLFRFDFFELPRLHETVGEENPVKVVQFMFDHLSGEVIAFEAFLFAITVAIFQLDRNGTFHLSPVAWDAETPLINNPFTLTLDDFRVDEDHNRFVREFDYGDSQGLANLSSGETNTMPGRL